MPYIGNTIRAADDYRLIDDISSSFNGSTTSFALQVAGSAPVPFPKSPQQVLISVNGVIQEPDPTGASGFNLVGTNIVFSSAPTNGHAFFGIIYATADYLNSGGNFPAGSLGAPSITFVGDEDTGIYRKGSGSIGFVADSTEIANTDSNGITISSGNLILPADIIHNGDTDTKIRFSSNDQISLETGGNEKIRINKNGDIDNSNNSYGSLSDIKLKENIVDANSQWDDIKALKVRNFNFKDDPDKVKMLGLVAQEAEAVSAGLVKIDNDIEIDETTGMGTVTGTTKYVKYSILYMKAVKALQEAQTRIETLETKVAALEGG